MFRFYTFLLLISITLFSCIKEEEKGRVFKEKQVAPSDLINKETFISILVDMHLLEGANSLNLVEINKARINQNVYQELIFKKYGVTKVTFNVSLKFYSSDFLLMQEIYDGVITELSRIQAANQ